MCGTYVSFKILISEYSRFVDGKVEKMIWQADAVVAITAAVYRHWELDNANRSFWDMGCRKKRSG